MRQLRPIGKIFYGLGIAGIGCLHFIYAGFRPFVLPIPPESTKHLQFTVYLTGAILVAAGIAIVIMKHVKNIAFFLGLFLLLFFIAGHLPNRLTNHPEILGAWTDALKLLAFSGGAFMIARSYYGKEDERTAPGVRKLSSLGKYFFALMLIIFGIDHFLYTSFVETLVPTWIGAQVFWTYFAGVALILSGLAIFLHFKPRTVGLLLGTMLFLWLILLHIPRAFAAPATDNGNEWTSVFQCLAFCGMALIITDYAD